MNPASGPEPTQPDTRRWWLVPALALLPLLAATLLVWNLARHQAEARDLGRFEERAGDLELALRQRFAHYGDALRGAQGLMDARGLPSEMEWSAYVEALRLRERYAGVRSFQFLPRVPASGVAAYNKASSHPIWGVEGGPDAPPRSAEAYFPVSLVEPPDPKVQSFDAASRPGLWEQVLRPAAERGDLGLGPRLDLVQSPGQISFLLYGPVYEPGRPLDTPEHRVQGLRGYVACLFYPEALFQDLVQGPSDLDVEVYDGATPTEANLLYDEDRIPKALGAGKPGLHAQDRRVELYGRTWTLHLETTQAWRAERDGKPELVLGVGLLLSFSIFAVLLALARGRARAVVLAQRMTSELREANRTLLELATTDSLTGLLNRRAIDVRISEEERRASRDKLPLAVVLLDVDFFKHVNDKYGHEMGDVVLRNLGAMLREHIRITDHAGRVGGEEFLLLLSNTGKHGARALAESLRARFEAMEHRSGELRIRCTASFGVACAEGGQEVSVLRLQRRADKALYAAKHNGRNRVEVWVAPAPQPPDSAAWNVVGDDE